MKIPNVLGRVKRRLFESEPPGHTLNVDVPRFTPAAAQGGLFGPIGPQTTADVTIPRVELLRLALPAGSRVGSNALDLVHAVASQREVSPVAAQPMALAAPATGPNLVCVAQQPPPSLDDVSSIRNIVRRGTEPLSGVAFTTQLQRSEARNMPYIVAFAGVPGRRSTVRSSIDTPQGPLPRLYDGSAAALMLMGEEGSALDQLSAHQHADLTRFCAQPLDFYAIGAVDGSCVHIAADTHLTDPQWRDSSCASALLANCLDLAASEDAASALHIAAMLFRGYKVPSDTNTAQRLYESIVGSAMYHTWCGADALTGCVLANERALVESLLALGIKADDADEGGQTPFDYAVSSRNLPMQALLKI